MGIYNRLAYRLGCNVRESSDTAQARAALLATAVAHAVFEEGLGGDPAVHLKEARNWAGKAFEHAKKAEPRILGRAHIWQALVLLLEDLAVQDRKKIEFHYAQAGDLLRKFPGGSLQYDFEILQRHFSPGGTAYAVLHNWLETRQGRTLDELIRAIMQLKQAETQNMTKIIADFDISYRRAYRLLGIRKMPKLPEGEEEIAS